LYRKSASRNELIFLLAKKGHKMSLTEYRFFHLLSIEKNKKKKKKKKNEPIVVQNSLATFQTFRKTATVTVRLTPGQSLDGRCIIAFKISSSSFFYLFIFFFKNFFPRLSESTLRLAVRFGHVLCVCV
jgi:hypothetical protein